MGDSDFEVEMQDNVKSTSQTEADGEVTSFGDFQRRRRRRMFWRTSWGSIVRLKLAEESCVRSGFESRSSASGAFAASPNSDSATFVGGKPR